MIKRQEIKGNTSRARANISYVKRQGLELLCTRLTPARLPLSAVRRATPFSSGLHYKDRKCVSGKARPVHTHKILLKFQKKPLLPLFPTLLFASPTSRPALPAAVLMMKTQDSGSPSSSWAARGAAAGTPAMSPRHPPGRRPDRGSR